MTRGSITAEQYAVLMGPLKAGRVAKRSQGGKELSYLESWDVRAHLTRVFGFGNFDLIVSDPTPVSTRPYENNGRPMVEVSWLATVLLVVRDPNGDEIARYQECAVGSTSGPESMTGEHHDNAIKTAASDALKRCAINLGTQFGLSLYQNGNLNDVVKKTVVTPTGYTPEEQPTDDEAALRLQESLGATPVDEGASA